MCTTFRPALLTQRISGDVDAGASSMGEWHLSGNPEAAKE